MEFNESPYDDVTNDSSEHVINVTNHDEDAEDYDMTNHVDTVMIVFYVLIGVCVIINVLLLATVFSSRKLRRGATAGLVVTLTISNVLSVICNVGIAEYQFVHQMELSGHIACKVGHYLDGMFHITSMFILVAIACDRYMAVCRPLSLQKRTGTPFRQGLIRAAACWFIAALLSVPNILINGMVADNTGDGRDNDSAWSSNETISERGSFSMNITGSDFPELITGNDTIHPANNHKNLLCDRDPPEWLHFYSQWQPIIDCVIGYVIPMIVIFTLYGITARTLVNSGTLERRASKDRHQQDREHAARSLVGLAAINLFIMLPMEILSLIIEYKLVDEKHLGPFFVVSFYTYVVSCMINTIMVYILSHKYRTQLVCILCICCYRRSGRHDIRSTHQTSGYRMNRFRMTSNRSMTGDSHSTTLTSSSKY